MDPHKLEPRVGDTLTRMVPFTVLLQYVVVYLGNGIGHLGFIFRRSFGGE